MESETGRASVAKEAAELLLSRSSSTTGSGIAINYGSMSTMLSTSETAFIDAESRRTCCGAMSVCRRTFCLLVTFDFIMTFLLWGVYVKVKADDWKNTTRQEVVHYTFQTSLFDVVIASAVRFLALIIAYAAFRIRNPSVIAVTTFVTCVYVVAKIFALNLLNHFESVVPYIPLMTSFIIVWIETWFLDFKVLPQELTYRCAWDHKQAIEREQERQHLLEQEEQQYHTPQWSPLLSHANSPRTQYGTIASAEENEYRRVAEDAWRQVHRLFVVDDGWKTEMCVDDIFVYSQQMDKLGKVLKLETYIEASPTKVFDESILNCHTITQWNPTILEYTVLQHIDACTDIAYNVTAPAAHGAVGSRDFVTLRHWKISEDQVILSSGCATIHSGRPPTRQHVRGENRLAGWEFRPIVNNPDRCRLRMIVSTDIKGWIPQRVVDQALTGVLLDYIRSLRLYISRLQTITV